MRQRIRLLLRARRPIALACAALPLVSARAASAEASAAPGLVIVLSIDQLRRDRLDAGLAGGLGWLVREGYVFDRAELDHAISETCPGHAVMVTGRHPGPSGIPANRFVERASGETFRCVDDPAPGSRVLAPLGRRGETLDDVGQSPRWLRVPTLGDWLEAIDDDTRVFSVSRKARAAIMLGGHRAEAAYFVQGAGFTTSLYYRDALPDWVRRFNGVEDPEQGFLATVPDQWIHDPRAADPRRPDDYPAEDGDRERASPHPLRDRDAEDMIANVETSPFIDRITLDFARRLMVAESLGRNAGLDLLGLSLSGTDLIGHAYGPDSSEARAGLEALDRDLAGFLEFVFQRVGRERVVIALTSDHGVVPLPEWLAETGRSVCPVEGGRVQMLPLALRLYWRLHRSFGSIFSLPRLWVDVAGSGLTVDRALARRRGVPLDRVVAETERFLEATPGIAQAWTEREILAEQSPTARLYRNSFDPERSGDIQIQVAETCLIMPPGGGTTHGTPHAYDRDVPLVLLAPGVPAGHSSAAARTVDLAPTLMRLLGLEPPPGLDGRALLIPGR